MRWILGGILFLAIIAGVLFCMSINQGHRKISINGVEYEMKIADTRKERYAGLSNLDQADFLYDGMLFLYKEPAERIFVMREMRFSLDIVWVEKGEVVKVEEGVPAPESGQDPQKMYSAPYSADMVLEFPAGFVHKAGIKPGDKIDVK